MSAKKNSLGRGLDALFADNSVEESSSVPVKLKITEIEPNREQPRKIFDENALSELADSIAKHGVIQPLLVRPLANGTYQLVAGERRWRAARIAGITQVPVVIKELSDEEAMELAMIENLQREDLNPLEEALGYKAMMTSLGITQDEAAEKVGKSRPAVANSLRLLNLPEEILTMLENRQISAGHARALLSFETQEEMLEAAKLVIRKGISVRELERLAKQAKKSKEGKPEKLKKRKIFYEEVELALGENLGRKVKVKETAKGTGTLEIEFFNDDDLSKLSKIFSD